MFKCLHAFVAKKILTTFWQILFKTLIVPSYKLFLFFSKKINKHLIHNPYLTKEQVKKTLLRNSPSHLVILALSLFVISSNFTTREIYAEELNKNSIAAQLFSEEIDEEIIETSPTLNKFDSYPKTESVLSQLTAIKSKDLLDQPPEEKTSTEQMTLSQASDALINPASTPFGEVATNNLTEDSTSQNKKEIQTYLVQSGDTLSEISKKFGLSVNTILWENNLSLNSYIRPGDELKILPTDGITYTIRSGDTVGAIATRYNSTIDKILAYNNLESASKIKVNQKLIIPEGKLGYTNITPTKSIYTDKKTSAETGNFIWPSVSKRITQYYHWGHNAIDIGAQTGTPIYAIRGGRIERAGWSTGYGYNIVINHGDGTKSLYGHASKLYVQQGQQVAQGEVIGAVGSTGWSTGPHIHLELIINGTKVNPLSYL